MTVDPVYRCRRLALAARLMAGDELEPYDWRRAALEPFDERVPFEPLPGSLRSAPADSTDKPKKFYGGPQF